MRRRPTRFSAREYALLAAGIAALVIALIFAVAQR